MIYSVYLEHKQFDIHGLLSLFGNMTKSVKKDPKKVSTAKTTTKKELAKEVVVDKKVVSPKPEIMTETTTKISAKKIISAKAAGEMAEMELEKMEVIDKTNDVADKTEKETVHHSKTKHSSKLENQAEANKKSNKIKFSAKKVLLALTSLATLIVIVLGGTWIWVLGTPEYAYYKMYSAAKEKNFDKFVEFIDTNATAEDLVKQESDYLKQNNINDIQAKFSIKGTLEYTFYQYIDSENLTKILPYSADDGWKIFDNKEISKDNDSFTVTLKSEPKLNNVEGIFGYKKMVFKKKGNKWVISQLLDNPGLDAAKKEAGNQTQTQQTNSPQ